MTFIVFDVESTGLNRKYARLTEPSSIMDNGDEVIQIGGLVLDADLQPTRGFCFYCDCMLAESHPEALAVHQITMRSIREVVPNVFLEDVLMTWVPEFFQPDVVFIGYNSSFDVSMVAQSLRNFCFDFENIQKVSRKLPESGRWHLDTMGYIPHRAKLTSYYTQLTAARTEFFKKFAGKLPLQTNAVSLLESSWESAHNAFYDSLETYLLFMTHVWNKRLFGGGGSGGRKRT